MKATGEKQMGLYFSATGKCKYAATRLVQAAEQEMRDKRPVWVKDKCVMCP